MKKISIKIALLGTMFLLPYSCLKDLDQLPEDARVTIEQQFQNAPFATYQGLNAKLYAQLSLAGQGGPNDSNSSDIEGFNAGFSNYFRLLWNTQELITDEAKNSWENDAGMVEMSGNNVNSSNSVINNFFFRIYTCIAKNNEFIRESTEEKINSRNLSEQEKTEVRYYRAEARFLRALHYYHAMDNFANVPFIDENDLPSTTAPKVRTREQIFSFIESELKDILPQLRAPKSIYGRADKAAAWMLLAKLYLNAKIYTGNSRYNDCKTYVDKVINEGGYTIDANYADTFKGDNHLSTEIIFPIVSDPDRSQSYGNMTYLICAAGITKTDGIDLQPSRYLGSSGQWGGNKTTKEFIGLFSSSDKRAMFDKRPGLIETISNLEKDREGYRVTKFTNVRRDGSIKSDAASSTFVDTDFPMFRLSDAYLMAVECAMNGAGGMDTAIENLNKLRRRAGVPEVTATSITSRFLADERGRELFWEAWRRQDLIRFGLLEGSQYVWNWKGTAGGGSLPSYMNLYPIPNEQIILNPNLKQNPGY